MYLNDLKLGIQKYHLLLRLIVININLISNDDVLALLIKTFCELVFKLVVT